mmetsp:Transcript_43314/g.113815  ORF Transcript_43314/g.113815 Transcript_43314/m.113815 type:complete len:161 (-) Transcript_43314:398-880(-)
MMEYGAREEKGMKVFVQASLERYEVEVTDSQTVGAVKAGLLSICSCSSLSQIQLLHGLQVLDDARPMMEYGVQDEGTLHLRILNEREVAQMATAGSIGEDSELGNRSGSNYIAPNYSAPEYKASDFTATDYEAPSYSATDYTATNYTAPSYTAPKYSVGD